MSRSPRPAFTLVNVDWHRFGTAVREARLAQDLSAEQLARKADVSTAYVSKLERGRVGRPGFATVGRIAEALGYATPEALLAGVKSTNGLAYLPRTGVAGPGSAEPNVVGRLEDLRSQEARLLPVYRWGSCGDPRDRESGPDPDHLEYPPPGKETLIGPNGFGVVVRGESMSNRGIHDGDTVWVNPDLPPKTGRTVLARCWDTDGQDVGMVVKVFKNTLGERLVSDGDGEDGRAPVLCARYEIIGPVVGISSWRVPD